MNREQFFASVVDPKPPPPPVRLTGTWYLVGGVLAGLVAWGLGCAPQAATAVGAGTALGAWVLTWLCVAAVVIAATISLARWDLRQGQRLREGR
jgi:hypothetical protein